MQQYLVNNGFIEEEGEDATLPPPLPSANEALYDAIVVNDKKANDPEADDVVAKPFETPPEDATSPNSL